MNADTGEIGGCCIRADVTVTFQFPKGGFKNPAAEKYLGRLVVATSVFLKSARMMKHIKS